MTTASVNSRTMAWTVWIIASVFYAYQYILRVMPNIMLNDIMDQFSMNPATFGQFSGIYYIGYSFLHLPVGILLDRFGPKKVMTGCILLTVIGLLPLLFAEHSAYPILGRFLIGVGSSAAILGVFKIVRMTFSAERFPRMLSLSVTIGLLGAIYGGGPVSYLLGQLGYQAVVQIFAVMGIALAAVTYWIVPNETAPAESRSVIADIKEVISHKRVMLSCLFAGFMVGTLEGFADVWGTVFLKQVYGFDSTLAASLPAMIYIGMCFGSPVLSFIADQMKSYLGTVIGAGVVMATAFGVMLMWQMPTTLLSVNLFVMGICCAYQILAIYQASTYVRVEVAGLTTAMANMIIMLFGYAFHAAIGGIVSVSGGTASSPALLSGLAVIPVALCIGLAGFIWVMSGERAQDPVKA